MAVGIAAVGTVTCTRPVHVRQCLQPSRPAENLEPLNFGPDLEPIKEEMTPRGSLEANSSDPQSARTEVMNAPLTSLQTHLLAIVSAHLYHFN